MGSSYTQVLKVPAVRQILLLSIVLRVPMWAAGVAMTLHVVGHLGRSYAEAGLIVTAMTVGAGISGPWRGRRLDRLGLRGTVTPSLAVLAVVWLVAPWVGYWALLPLVFLGGLMIVPSFSIVRQVLIANVQDTRRTSALALDSVLTEITFMVGPVLGVLVATEIDTRYALLGFEMAAVLAGLLLWWVNPPIVSESETATASTGRWITPAVLAILGVCVAATVVLNGTDLAIVAALRSLGSPGSIGWVLAAWGAGSAVGGLGYGALRRHPPSYVLLAMLGLTTVPAAWASSPLTLALILFVAGVFCAPTITATVSELSRAVPSAVRGEAMGWHGSAMTAGGALGAPAIGYAIDHGGWDSGFVTAGLLGAVLAGVAVVAIAGQRVRRSATAR